MAKANNYYDVIIVGARCAGSALAAVLARRGVRVLVLDAAKLPSDMLMSTHYLQALGMDVLDELGVGEAVRALAPRISDLKLAVDGHEVLSRYPNERAGICLRRFKLDALLQEAAVTAGAELRDRHRVVDLVREGERVVGVVVQTPAGEETLRADLVVGADGRHSKIAQLAGAEEYLGRDMTRSGYWAYWPKPADWDARADASAITLALEGEGMRYIFPTDDNLVLLVAAPPAATAATWGKDYREAYREYLRGSPLTAPLVEAAEPVGKVVGLRKARCFYRRAVGPGFALVGDAGNVKDFVTGQGMTDALLGARDLAAAILDGRPLAMEWYWRQRDAATMPLYLDSLRIGAVGANDALLRLATAKAARSETLAARFADVADRRIAPAEAVPARDALGWTLAALCRGQWDVVAAFWRSARLFMSWDREIRKRRRLLNDCLKRLGTPPQLPAASCGIASTAPHADVTPHLKRA